MAEILEKMSDLRDVMFIKGGSPQTKGKSMNCRYCGKSEKGQMIFIQGYCWDCLIKTQKSSNLPIEVLVEMIKEGAEIA